MTIIDNLQKRPQPTTPDDTSDPPRFAQPVETTKDAFVVELTKFFNRADISRSRLEEIPTIRKFDVSLKKSESSHETAVKIIRKLPNVNENLPLVAVLGATGRNRPMGFSGQFVAPVAGKTFVASGNNETYDLSTITDPLGKTLKFRTVTPNKDTRITTILLRDGRFSDLSAATAAEIVKEINFQSLYARASVNVDGGINISYGGVADGGKVTGDIIIGDGTGDTGTAAAVLGFVNDQASQYLSTTPSNRYHQTTTLDIAIEVVAEDDNIRTELNDLVWSFFTFYMDERDYMFLGRSIFDPSIPNETYQVIIKPDPSMAGESEVPRPGGDEVDKLYVNRINVPVTTIQYTDRAVVGSAGTPFYLDADKVVYDGTIPQKN